MAHHTLRSGYTDLVERLNRFPQGAPPSEVLYHILELLFGEHEAKLVARLPIRPFNVEKAARRWKTTIPDAQRVLDELASRPSFSTSTERIAFRPPWRASSNSR